MYCMYAFVLFTTSPEYLFIYNISSTYSLYTTPRLLVQDCSHLKLQKTL